MTEDEITFLAIRGAISQLSGEERKIFLDLEEKVRALLKEAGSPAAEMVIALIGAEMQLRSD